MPCYSFANLQVESLGLPCAMLLLGLLIVCSRSIFFIVVDSYMKDLASVSDLRFPLTLPSTTP